MPAPCREPSPLSSAFLPSPAQPYPTVSRGGRAERSSERPGRRRRRRRRAQVFAAAAAVARGVDCRRSLFPMGELEAGASLGPDAQHPLRRARSGEQPCPGAGRRRKAVRALSRLARRLLQTLRGARRRRREREGAEVEDDEGGFKRPPGPDRERSSQAGGTGGGGGGRRVSWGALNPPPLPTAASSGDPRPLTPGAQGLKNHGNTCFLNAVVQCLSHTELLAAFLLLAWPDQQGPPAPGAGTASGGEVTRHLAALVRALWTLEYTPQLSADFKNVVSKYGTQFRGNSQHDALEFLLWLLDRMHEDLCSVPLSQKLKAPEKTSLEQEEISSSGNTQPIVQPPKVQSFVQNHFQAQYRSSLTCPHCLKQSNTFDPFLCISLPIPLRQTRPLNITLVFQSKSQRFVRVGLSVPLFSTVAKLREMVAEEGKISPDQVILAELGQSGFQCSFSDDEDLNTIAEGDSIFAFQAPLSFSRTNSSRLSGCPHSLPSSPNTSEPENQRLAHNGAVSSEFLHHGGGGKILLLVCNVAGTGQQAIRFGPPLLMREDRAMTWDQLQQCILSKMRYLMRKEAQMQASENLFQVRVVGGSALCSYLSPQDSWPLYHPAVDRAIQFGGPGGPTHVKLVVEWDVNTKERLFGSIQEEVVEDADSVRMKQQLHQQQYNCTLDECFQLYTKEEQLAPDDAWRCPHCQVLQQGMVKLSLWTLPDILIIHLKRFRQVGEQRHKLSTLVHFPLRGLDMAPHVAKRSRGSKWSSWKYALPESSQCNFLYDLYAVCNHHGSMQGGHYTAYCRNTLDGHWYSYDDSTVEPVLEEDVSTRGAYILFYQKRSVALSWSEGSSLRGSTSSSVSEHWLTRLSGSKRESLVSRSSATCSSQAKTPDSPTLPNASISQEKGGFESRPLVRGVQGRSVSLKASPTKSKLGIPKPMPLRWSFTSKDWPGESSGELVKYLESGRRPRFTNESIVPLMTKEVEDNGSSLIKARHNPAPVGVGTTDSSGKALSGMENVNTLKRAGKLKEDVGEQPRTPKKLVLSLSTVPPIKDGELKSKVNTNGALRTGTSLPPSGYQSKGKGIQDQKATSCVGEREPEGERQPEGKLAIFRAGFLRKDPKRHSESDRHGVMAAAVASSRVSLSNGTLSSITSSRAPNCTLSRSSTEGLSNGRICRSELDIKRAQSSGCSKGKSDWLLSRSASLCKANNSVSLQSYTPPLALEGVSCGTFQRARYHTASLGRRTAVPESSF
uniref:ubiquitinyl hydrolase 1 n=1 Tax=Salvator merianae TaxID=96440 RepID=A0A8D0EBT2_SALMN